MDTLTRYVGETKPFTTTLTEPVQDPISGVTYEKPIILTGLVSSVRFMAEDAATGATAIDKQAAIDEVPGNDATNGTAHYTPTSLEVGEAAEWIQWWRLVMAADGTTQDTGETLIRVREHGIAEEATLTATGVCQAWATNEDVFQYAAGASAGQDYEPWLIEASEILYALSGRRFSGGCSRTVRPQVDRCSCFQVLSRGHIVYPLDWEWIGGRWCAEGGLFAGCGSLARVDLPGYVQSIPADGVKISGAVIDPATYRVDMNHNLIRLSTPGGDNPGWPMCQDLTLPTGAPGTFEVTYVWGEPLPASAVRAAALLAFQLWVADNPDQGGVCQLPAGWTSVSRQGITVSRSAPSRFPTEGTGLIGIDSFLNTYNPYGHTQQPSVYSGDVAPLPYRVS